MLHTNMVPLTPGKDLQQKWSFAEVVIILCYKLLFNLSDNLGSRRIKCYGTHCFHRKGASRYLTVYKREGSSIVQADAVFQLVRSSRQHVYTLLHKFPLTNKERQELLPLTERDRILNPEGEKVSL